MRPPDLILDWVQHWPDSALEGYWHQKVADEAEALAIVDRLLLDGYEVPFAQTYWRHYG